MLHKYRKTALIEAEQFDGSDEMIEKYDIEASVTIFISQYVLTTKKRANVRAYWRLYRYWSGWRVLGYRSRHI